MTDAEIMKELCDIRDRIGEFAKITGMNIECSSNRDGYSVVTVDNYADRKKKFAAISGVKSCRHGYDYIELDRGGGINDLKEIELEDVNFEELRK
mgnify:CR=1 FL=1